MKPTLTVVCAAVCCAMASMAQAQAQAQAPAPQRPYPTVTDARLASPEPANWLMYRGNYSGWGYSPLAQINDGNVGKLSLAWAYTTGVSEGHQAPPIVNGGYMYVSTPGSQLIALDAKTGNEIWRYKGQIPAEQLQLHPTNRGVALYGDRVYLATVDCNLIALDAKTGKQVWTSKVCEWKNGYYMTLAPLAAKGKIMVGSSGGETGVRGFVAAYDAETGKEAWRTYTVPGPGEAGPRHLARGRRLQDRRRLGLDHRHLRPEDQPRLLGHRQPGAVAHRAAQGRQPLHLVDDRARRRQRQDQGPPPVPAQRRLGLGRGLGAAAHRHHLQGQADQGGGARRPQRLPVGARAHRRQGQLRRGLRRTSTTTSSRASIRRPAASPSIRRRRPAWARARRFCPGLWGGKDWPPEAYNPNTGLLYVPANNNMCGFLPAGENVKYKPGDLYIGYPLEGVLGSVRVPNPDQTIGELQAWDMKTGKLAWAQKFKTFLWAPLMTTGGNLVFAGGMNDRTFRAFDARTGKILWQHPTPSGVVGVPTSFEVDGEQYVAVQSGWGVDAERLQGAFNAILPERAVVNPQGGTVLVFKLPKS